MNALISHDWEALRFTKHGQPTNRTGKRCKRCGVMKYNYKGAIRWKTQSGEVFDTHTVDETSCDIPNPESVRLLKASFGKVGG